MEISIEGRVTRIDQTEKSIQQFIEENRHKNKSVLTVLESTGGYERLAANCLSKANMLVHIAHPNRVRDYAKAKGFKAKTDKLDAMILEGYGHFIEPKNIYALPTKKQQPLNAISGRLAQLKETHHQECCRLGIAMGVEVKRSHQKLIKVLAEEIKKIGKELLTLIQSDEER